MRQAQYEALLLPCRAERVSPWDFYIQDLQYNTGDPRPTLPHTHVV